MRLYTRVASMEKRNPSYLARGLFYVIAIDFCSALCYYIYMNNFKIYTNGQYDTVANIKYKLSVKKEIAISNLKDFGNKVDYFFVNSKWPTTNDY